MSPTDQLFALKEKLPCKCPLAIEEVMASLARCELVYNNLDDKIEQYFAHESIGVLRDMAMQLLTLASHPNIKDIAESAPGQL
jgi:hypothetical protein